MLICVDWLQKYSDYMKRFGKRKGSSLKYHVVNREEKIWELDSGIASLQQGCACPAFAI